jgi:hypothetical protein
MAEAGDQHRSGRNPVQPYRALDTAKRRRAGGVYLVMAAGAGALASLAGVPLMWFTAVLPLAALAIYQFIGGWKIEVADMDAIEQAGEATSFAVGHGSATLGFRGFRARPVWQVLVFGDGPSPEHQALVTIDAVSGDVTGLYEEPVDQP